MRAHPNPSEWKLSRRLAPGGRSSSSLDVSMTAAMDGYEASWQQVSHMLIL